MYEDSDCDFNFITRNYFNQSIETIGQIATEVFLPLHKL